MKAVTTCAAAGLLALLLLGMPACDAARQRRAPSSRRLLQGEQCGEAASGASCGEGQCCSEWGFCGAEAEHCGAGCQPDYGSCGASPGVSPSLSPSLSPSPSPSPDVPTPDVPTPDVPAPPAPGPGVPPSLSPPGGLDPANTPMFILFTHDDAITQSSHDLMREVTDGRSSLNGCPATATMFTLRQDTDCNLLRDLHTAGYEIADHTLTHGSVKGLEQSALQSEVVGARSSLATDCGIPESDIVGFRAPLLETDAAVRQMLAGNGFLYESSLIEVVNGNAGPPVLTTGMAARVWPFTMDGGIPMACQTGWFTHQTCDASESYPGLWQVPVWQLLTDPQKPHSMDYGKDPQESAYTLLQQSFDAAYSGNRAPLPIFIHSIGWLDQQGFRDDVKRFLDYALAKPDVYAVTMRQLIAWMQNPIPADQLSPQALGCGSAGGAGGSSS